MRCWELYPVSRSQLKSCLHTLVGPIALIENVSLSSVNFPDNFKYGYVNPLLKKPHLPANDLNTYTRISFISKVLEKVVSDL